MRRAHKEKQYMDSAPDYPVIEGVETNTEKYLEVIERINHSYRKMLKIGDSYDAFKKSKESVSSMLQAKSEEGLKQAEENVKKLYQRHIDAKKGRLQNFCVKTELRCSSCKLHGSLLITDYDSTGSTNSLKR